MKYNLQKMKRTGGGTEPVFGEAGASLKHF
jgi:hypothetical protein